MEERHRERETEYQAGFMLLAQSPTWDSNWQTVRLWPESQNQELDAQLTEPPRHPCVVFFFFFLFYFFYIYSFLRDREAEQKRGRGRERGRHRIWSSSRLRAVSTEADAGLKLRNWDHDLSWSRMHNRLNHPGTPVFFLIHLLFVLCRHIF